MRRRKLKEFEMAIYAPSLLFIAAVATIPSNSLRVYLDTLLLTVKCVIMLMCLYLNDVKKHGFLPCYTLQGFVLKFLIIIDESRKKV